MIKDQHLMKKDGLLYDVLKESNLTENQKDVARVRAGILESFEERAKAQQRWIDAIQDKRDVGQKLLGCKKCKERWMSPHADYVISEVQPLIDRDRI